MKQVYQERIQELGVRSQESGVRSQESGVKTCRDASVPRVCTGVTSQYEFCPTNEPKTWYLVLVTLSNRTQVAF
ncbi:MAG: hypothetical protein KME38_10060 [Spirirestis rafaelensis WJT71-NPBG6]|nr:hypothetical protein [Spirirestis rafaelensis WJT71-NPBG6]